jgi:hypothetical protein
MPQRESRRTHDLIRFAATAMGVMLWRREGAMAAGAAERLVLDAFRAVWVRGRLDYQRAVDALEAALIEAERARAVDDSGADDSQVRRAEENVQAARRRVAETEAALGRQFDRFCSASR